ncbi:MAG: PAS domain S-box protein, partial [Desulfuromonadaceae bacterium]
MANPKENLKQSEQERMDELTRENRRLSRELAELKSVVKALRESEARSRSFFEDVTEGIVIAEVASKRFLQANSAFCRMLGYASEEISALGVADIHPQESLQNAFDEFETLACGKKLQAVDVPCLRKDGTLLYADIVGSAMRFDGRDCLVGHFIDVTERKRATDALRKREEKFRAIADYTYDWECWIAPDGSLLWVNPAVEKFTGYSSQEWLRKPHFLSRIIPIEDRAQVRKLLEKGLRERSSGNHIPFRIQHRDGSLRWVAISYQPIYGKQGEFLGLRTSARDITESRHIEEQVQRLGVLKEQLLQQKSL